MSAVKGLRAGFESELASRLTALSAADAQQLTERIHAECLARGFTYDREEGGRTAINFLPLPVLMTARERATLQAIGWTLRGILVKVLLQVRADAALRPLLPLEAGEERLLARVHTAAHDADPALLFRLDVDIDFCDPAWPEKAAFYEFNGSSVGGYHYSKVSETMIGGLVAEALGVPVPARVVDGMPDLMLAVMRRQAERLGRRRLNIAYIEDREWTTGITEGPSLAEYFTRAGARAVVVDPRELRLHDGEVYAGELPVDVVYRNMEMRDLVAIEAESGPLVALEQAFARDQVVSSLWGDFDHKSLWEVLDTPAVLERLAGKERAFLRRHLPWTRILRPVHSRTPASERADLPEYVRDQRDNLVIKPNRGCGGAGVTLGPKVTPAEWDAAIEFALKEPGEWVVQTLVKNARRPFPMMGEDGRFHMEELFTAYGFLSSADMFGCLGRASRGAVVNVSQGGGIFPVLSEA